MPIAVLDDLVYALLVERHLTVARFVGVAAGGVGGVVAVGDGRALVGRLEAVNSMVDGDPLFGFTHQCVVLVSAGACVVADGLRTYLCFAF